MFCHRALKEDTNDGKTKGVASELQDEGEEDEDEEDEEDADGDGDPAARGSNEEAGAAAINEKLFLGICNFTGWQGRGCYYMWSSPRNQCSDCF